MTTGRINQIDIYCVSHDIAIADAHTHIAETMRTY